MVYSLYPLHIMMLWKGVFAMLVIPIRRICDAKMKQIMDGYTAYSESKQVINKLKKKKSNKETYQLYSIIRTKDAI